jgi:hypothetical protein
VTAYVHHRAANQGEGAMNSSGTTPTAEQILAALTPAVDPNGGEPLPAYYGMVMLGLASQAYTTQGDGSWPQIQSALNTAITDTAYTPALPSPLDVLSQGPTVAGSWSLDWGPANGQDGDGDNSNLMYIASYRAPPVGDAKQGAPYFFVVSIRGTDTSITGTPLIQQLLQDIRDFELKSWPLLLSGTYILDGTVPAPNTRDVNGINGHVAHGSMLGFIKLANFTAPLNNGAAPSNGGNAVTVVAALNSLIAQYGHVPIVVTGHSLGACQTQLMASYLAWQFPVCDVIPYCYAPPTAGDGAFIATYSKQCPAGQFWYNTYDVVPFAYITMTVDSKTQSGLSWAGQNLWASYQWPPQAGGQPNGPPLPPEFTDLIATAGTLIPASYMRPANGVFGLPGNIPEEGKISTLLEGMGMKVSATGGLAQLIWQHFPPCYAALMNAQYGSVLAPFAFAAYKPGLMR